MMLTCLYDVLKLDTNDSTKKEIIKSYDTVLSLNLLDNIDKHIDEDLKKYIEEKIKERKIAKENKDYALADNIRNELESKGIIIKDTKDGVIYEVI